MLAVPFSIVSKILSHNPFAVWVWGLGLDLGLFSLVVATLFSCFTLAFFIFQCETVLADLSFPLTSLQNGHETKYGTPPPHPIWKSGIFHREPSPLKSPWLKKDPIYSLSLCKALRLFLYCNKTSQPNLACSLDTPGPQAPECFIFIFLFCFFLRCSPPAMADGLCFKESKQIHFFWHKL